MPHDHAAEEIARHVRSLPLFAGCSDRQVRRLAALARITSIRAGKLVMLERHRGEQFHVIVEGRARVARGDEEVALLSSGDLLGEIGLLEQVDRTATVIAHTALKMLSFDTAGFRALMEEHPEVAARIRAAATARRTPIVEAP